MDHLLPAIIMSFLVSLLATATVVLIRYSFNRANELSLQDYLLEIFNEKMPEVIMIIFVLYPLVIVFRKVGGL